MMLLTWHYLELGCGCGREIWLRQEEKDVCECSRLSPSTAAWGCPSHLAPRSFLGRARPIHLKPILIDFETFNHTDTDTDSVK